MTEAELEHIESITGRGAGDPDIHGYPGQDEAPAEQAETGHCPTCGASTKKYWYRITPALVDILIIVLEAVRAKDANMVDMRELRDHLKPFQYTQLTKLRFHGLIAKHKVDDAWDGHWVLTSRAGQFLRGEISIPLKVQTFRNKVVAHDDLLIDYRGLMGTAPYIQTEPESSPASQADIQAALNLRS